MSEASAEARVGRVEFTGSRHELVGIIARGYALMIPTIGLYRFWLATWKRRFYWQNTVIDGDPLEYTGTPTQLLAGFFFALAFFLPIYIALFYFSMQSTDYTLLGYVAAGAVIWFLAGYAIYRARDFRLSRTLWRGIRFDLRGNAWAYALGRFFWSIAMVATLGLVYPWMASSLWRYRWRNTWYGDRKFDIGGNWLVFALPYYGAYFLNLVAIVVTLGWIQATHDFVLVAELNNFPLPGPLGLLACLGCVVIFAFSLAWYRARTASRMLSTVTVGDAKITMKVGGGALLGQYIVYILAVSGLLVVLTLTALLTVAGIYISTSGGKSADTALVALFQSGSFNVALLIAIYLIVLAAFGMLSEVILGLGWWKLLARGATIAAPDSLRTVRASAEDRTLIGQGLADALNVGAY